jgi:DNA-binding transcriptional LysR family regulator
MSHPRNSCPGYLKDVIELINVYYFYYGINHSAQGMTDPRLLKHFVSVYRSHSFRVAADQLGISQSTVTKSIQRLETQLGVRLFNRTTRTVEATDTARQLIARAEQALTAMGSFDEDARLLAGGELGGIRVGAIALAAESLVVTSLARLSRTHPNLDVEVVVGSSDVYRDLATGECDVAIGDEANFHASVHSSSLKMLPLYNEELVLVHRAGHPATGSAALAEFADYPLAIPSRYFNENRLLAAMNRQADAPESPRYRLNSLSACLTLAATSDVVTLSTRSVAEQSIAGNSQPRIEIANLNIGIDIHLVLVTVARSAPTPAVQAFHEACTALR